MQCPACSAHNDSDAAFCIECGRPIIIRPSEAPLKSRKIYLFAFVLVPMLVIVAAIGYYKFILPDGIAAVVNGEDIKTTELDAAAVRVPGAEETSYRGYRYEALNRLIIETLVFQEARKAGIRVSEGEIAAATAEASHGLNVAAFRQQIALQYGGNRQFEQALERRVLITKYIDEKIIPKGADRQTAQLAVNKWTQALLGNAMIRVALSEQGANSSCCAQGWERNRDLLKVR
jgi:hypothetical protein